MVVAADRAGTRCDAPGRAQEAPDPARGHRRRPSQEELMSAPWDAPIERAGSQHQVARELRGIMVRAQELAAERGAPAAEAEHLLIAIAEHPQSRGGAFL